MALNLTLPQKGLVLVIVPLLFQLVFIMLLAVSLRQAEYEAQREAHTKEMTVYGNRAVTEVSNFAKFLANFWQTGERENLTTCDFFVSRFGKVLPKLKELATGNPTQEKLVSNLEMVYKAIVKENGEAKTLPLTDTRRWQTLVSEAAQLNDLTITEVQLLAGDESMFKGSAHERGAEFREHLKTMTLVATGADVLLAIGLAVFFSLQILRRLKVLSENSHRLGMDLPLLAPLKGKDEIGDVDHVFHDMADALAEARRKERAMIENTVDVICSIDAEGNFLNVNIASQKVWNYSRDELLSRNYQTMIASEDVRNTEQAIQEIIESKAGGAFENRVARKDGTLVPSLWSASWSPTEKALFCVVHDITERKELERAKQDFMAMVSHDLRTPLSSLHGGLLLLASGKHGDLTDKGKGFVETGKKSVDRLIRLINDLLDMEKLEAGKFDMEFQEVQIQEVIERSAREIKELADKAIVRVKTPVIDLPVSADEERLVQVMVNLLGNSIKFSPPGSTIDISVEQPPGWVEIRVADQGPGIPAEYRQAIFDRFRQLPGGKQKKGSTGLGLAICKAIVEQHGGMIGVNSEEGKGSTFWFRIPSGEQIPDEG